jgi:transcriptional regulator with XRE-family HTH domain
VSRGNGADSGGSTPADGSAQALDPQACGEIGGKLAVLREERGWTLADAADRLLLSTAQVSGLERADASAFHNPSFFASALRKYAALCGLECPDAILTTKARAASAHSNAASTGDSIESRRRYPVVYIVVAVVILVLCGAALAWYFHSRTDPAAQPSGALAPLPPPTPVDPPALQQASPSATAGQPAPAPPAAAPAPAPLPPPAPAPPPPAITADERAGMVTLSRPAWVFVRYRDNSTTERVLQSGQSLMLTSNPIYLAIGTGEGVTLTLRGRPIDVSPYRKDDEIRIRATELAALAR